MEIGGIGSGPAAQCDAERECAAAGGDQPVFVEIERDVARFVLRQGRIGNAERGIAVAAKRVVVEHGDRMFILR